MSNKNMKLLYIDIKKKFINNKNILKNSKTRTIIRTKNSFIFHYALPLMKNEPN